MATTYLSRDELAELVGCQPTSRACMRRWLTRNDWPFEADRNGFPKVLRHYFDQRMHGENPTPPKKGTAEPNYAIFEDAKKRGL